MTLVGVPAKADILGIYLLMPYLEDKDGMTNVRSVVEILHAAKVEKTK